MALTTVIAGVLSLLLVVALGVTYLMYVRMQQLREELESMKSQVSVHEEELENIESSLKGVEL